MTFNPDDPKEHIFTEKQRKEIDFHGMIAEFVMSLSDERFDQWLDAIKYMRKNVKPLLEAMSRGKNAL